MLTRFAAPPNDRGQANLRTGASLTGLPNTSLHLTGLACGHGVLNRHSHKH
jgi:hypothetical protein